MVQWICKKQTAKGALRMDRIKQEGYWRQRVIKYARIHGGTAAAIRKRYHGTAESLKDRPPTPRHSPIAQSPEERDLVRRYAKKYPDDLPPGYEKPRPYGYAGSYGGNEKTSRTGPPIILGRKLRWT